MLHFAFTYEKLFFQFWFFYQKTEVEREQETFLYDFSGIVASVGGSLGLFLGFSCLQVAMLFVVVVVVIAIAVVVVYVFEVVEKNTIMVKFERMKIKILMLLLLLLLIILLLLLLLISFVVVTVVVNVIFCCYCCHSYGCCRCFCPCGFREIQHLNYFRSCIFYLMF